MNLLIASDHAGYELKEILKAQAAHLGVTFTDLGPANTESVDYPDYANLLSKKLIESNRGKKDQDENLGILICGSGVGVSIAANRFPEIRAVLAESPEVSALGRAHNHANVLCLGAKVIDQALALNIVKAFLSAKPDQGERHLRRIQKLKGIKI